MRELMLGLLRRLVTCFEVHKDIGLPSDVSTAVLSWLKDLLQELFVIIPPATRSRFEANCQQKQPPSPKGQSQRAVGGIQPRKRKRVATSPRGGPLALKKRRLQHEPRPAEVHLIDVAPRECRGIATQEPIREALVNAEGPEELSNPSPLPVPPAGEEVDLRLARWDVALDCPAPCERILIVAEEADALPHARKELSTVQEESSYYNGYRNIRTTEAEGGDTPFSLEGKSLVRSNCEDLSGEATETDGNTTELVPWNPVPSNLFAATSSPPAVIHQQETITPGVRGPAYGQAMPSQSEKAEVHITADPPGESMQHPRQNNEGAEMKAVTKLPSKIRVSFPTKPRAHRAKKVSLTPPVSLIHMQTQRQGHGKPLTLEYLFGMPFSQLRRLAEQRGIDVGGEKGQLVKRLLLTTKE